MRKETEYTFDGNTYLIKQLPLTKSQEVLVRLMSLLGAAGAAESALLSLPTRLTVADIEFLRERLLGENCLLQNDTGNWAPMVRGIVENHFDGRIGALFHLLGKCLIENYSSFLKDLRLDELAVQATTPE